MTTWQQNPGAGYYPGQQGPDQGYPYPNQNPGYPPNQGYPHQPAGYTAGYPPPYSGAPAPGFVPPNIPPYGQVPNSGIPPTVPIQPGMYGTSYGDETHQEEIKGFDFSDRSIRRGFIRKVYSILMCQLVITCGMIALFLYHQPTQRWVREHQAVFWIALVATFVLLIAMACCTTVRRTSPMNYIFLFLFTIAESFVLATAASRYESSEVLLAVGITALICFALTIFAFQTKWDFTTLNGILFVAVIVLFIFGIVATFWQNGIVRLIYACLGALIFSVYLVYDTQLMIGGDHKYSISPEEYIFAALNLYIDIVNIFLYILAIIGASRD